MSVFKIERDIKLLEEKLEEINTTVTDPIERNEYKKELQRQIKKLNRTKYSLEQLHKEQQDLESLKLEVSPVKQDREIIDKPQSKTKNNQRTVEKQRENNRQVSKIKNIDDWEDEFDTPSNVSSNSWQDDSRTPTYKNTQVVEDLKDTMQMQANISSSQISQQIYLSKREIWISTVFAILNFIFPYIYTRRWKPLCVAFISLIFVGGFVSEESALSAAPWISAIDNGIAIAKSKSKLKRKK